MDFLSSIDWFLIFTSLLKTAAVLGIVLTMVSYTVYAERRVSALIQDRIGPNRVGFPHHPPGREEGFLAVPRRPGPAHRGRDEAPAQGGFHPRPRQ